MAPKYGRVALLSIAAVVAVAGLSHKSADPSPAAQVQTVTPASSQAPAPARTATPSPTATPTPEAPQPAAQDFRAWLDVNYPGVSWVQFVQSSEEKFGALWIHTSLYPDADAAVPSRALCTAGKAYVLETGAPYTGTVTVRASTGLRLAEC